MPSYQLFYLLAIVVGCGLISAEGRRRNYDADRWALCIAAWAVGGIAGAILPGLVLGELAATRTAVGAVAGATIALGLAGSLLRIRSSQAIDATAIAIPVGGAVARLGCFVAECCHGLPTTLPVGLTGSDGVHRHPTQLYEAAFDIAVATWLTRVAPHRWKEGHRFIISLALLSAGRFAVEFLRDSDRLGPLSLAQWIVGPMAVICIGVVGRGIPLPNLRPHALGRAIAAALVGVLIGLGITGRLRPLEVSAIAIAVLAVALLIAIRNQRLAHAGAAALMLQMPAPADTTFPQRFAFWGIGAGGGGYTRWHDDQSCDSGPFNEWSRFHKYYGGSIEGGYLRQGSQWSGMGVRGRASYSIDHADHAIVTLGTVRNPRSYSTTNYSAGGFIDLTSKYAALTLGGTFGEVRPSLTGDIVGDTDDPMPPLRAYPGVGIRLGPLFGPSIEARYGDEVPMNIAMPMFTIGVAGGDANGNRLRFGVSDAGLFLSGTFKRPNGLEIMPIIHGYRGGRAERQGGGIAVRQWTRIRK